MKTILLLLVSGLAGALFPATAAPISLVENGRATAVIVVPDAKPPRAATDLRDFIAKATGAQLDIIEERTPGASGRAGSRVFVGPCEAANSVVDDGRCSDLNLWRTALIGG